MKRIIIFLSMLLFLSFGVKAQDPTLSTSTTQPTVGAIEVPVDVANLGDILMLSIYYYYDASVLTYTGATDYLVDEGYYTVTENAGYLLIEVENVFNEFTVVDGTLLNLQFNYLGGYSDLTFGTTENPVASSVMFATTFVTYTYTDADVTNGAVQGYYDAIISGGDWHTAGNWSTSAVPNAWANVTVAAGTETTVSADAAANDVTVGVGGQLTLNTGFTLAASGDFLIESETTGQGSFINYGILTVGGTQSAQCYVGDDVWHGIAAPVSGEDFHAMFFNFNPEVWVSEFDEAAAGYSPVSDLFTPMGDMKGWMTEIENGQAALTFTFEGAYRTGTVGVANNMLHADAGHNLVGNPFTSAIDWDAASGWTKTDMYDAIYLTSGGNWASYVGGTGVNGGTQYIAMNQGFFVQSNTVVGTLQMTNDVCVHNAVAYLKAQDEQQIVRLEIQDNDMVDETVIRFTDNATNDFDGDWDASKFFSFESSYPQIFSTANGNMSINSLPFSVLEESVALDVTGTDGNILTITATEFDGFDKLYLKDEFTNDIADLKNDTYSFVYDANVDNRFTLLFGITDINENASSDIAKIFAYQNTIQVVLDGMDRADISVYNLLGQVVTSSSTTSMTSIPMEKTGYYLVKVSDGTNVITKKVFIK